MIRPKFLMAAGTLGPALSLGLAWMILAGPRIAVGDQPASDPTAKWVSQLDSQAYQTRITAKRRLIELAETRPQRVTRSLRQATDDPSIEVRLAAAELLDELEQRRTDNQLNRLLDPRNAAETIDLPGWPLFAQVAGTDLPARELFARLVQRYGKRLSQIDRFAKLVADHQHHRHDASHQRTSLDPYHIASDDIVRWTTMLWMDMAAEGDADPTLASRIATAISNPAMGPSIDERSSRASVPRSRDENIVLRRMIGRWMSVRPRASHPRTMLVIAMRYRCDDQARRWSLEILADRSSPASAVVTAMLSASAMELDQCESRLQQRLTDHRTAHVWQIIGSENSKIRTEVRDVALALLLHRRGIDPRQAGFDQLQADPTLVFTDHSLGFPDQQSRDQAYEMAMPLLDR